MSSIDTIKATIQPEIDSLNALMRSQLRAGNPLMDAVIEGFLTSKGKQIRPIVVMLCAAMFGRPDDKVLHAAAAVELLHNASLIHDDVVDDSKLRRGKPTVNAVWDNHIAVLVGDYFVSTALQQAIATGDIRIVGAIGELGKLLSLGEIDQIYNAREHLLDESAYFRTIDLKTASLFVACANVGCYAAGAPERETAALGDLCRLLGLCFQLRDDVFDYFEPDKVGKPTGNDLREGKVTLPLLHALDVRDEDDRHQWLAVLAQDELTDAEIAALQAFARQNGGIDYAYARMADLRRQAQEIAATLPGGAERIMSLFDYIIERDF